MLLPPRSRRELCVRCLGLKQLVFLLLDMLINQRMLCTMSCRIESAIPGRFPVWLPLGKALERLAWGQPQASSKALTAGRCAVWEQAACGSGAHPAPRERGR